MNKQILIAGFVSALISAQANASQACKDLTAHNFLAVYGDSQPLSGVLNQALKKTGWKLDYKQVSAEPMIKGEIKGSVESIVVSLVTKSIEKDWRINLAFENEKCEVLVDVLNEQAPETMTSLKPVAVTSIARPSPVPPVAQSIPISVKKSLLKKSSYIVKKGQKLEDIFMSWAKQNGGESFWMHDEHIYVHADSEYIGSLSGAVSGLIQSLGAAGEKINVHLFSNGYIRVEGAK